MKFATHQRSGHLQIIAGLLNPTVCVPLKPVALANKTARIAWAMIRNGTDYQAQLAAGRAP